MAQLDEHLRPIDFHALVDGRGPDGEIADPERLQRLQRHVEACQKCGEELDAYRRADASLAAVCGPLGAETMNEADWDFIASLQSAKPEWQRMVAGQLRRPRQNRWRVYTALVAASIAFAIGIGMVVSHGRNVDALLAQAYTDSRPMEFRLPDKGYRPVSATRGARGGIFSQPPSLREAAGEIEATVRSRGATPALNRQKAEVELLQLDYTAALDLLDRNDARNAMLLACAYFLRAESQPEAGTADYARALDLLERIRQSNPADSISLFNVALTREKLHDQDGARKAWREYLDRDSSSGYAEEARGRLAELEKKSERRLRGLEAVGAEPEKYLALSGREGIPAEFFLDTALTKWLPRTAEDPQAIRAAEELSQGMLDQSGDPMLSEMLNSHPPRHAVEELAQAILLARSGDPLGGLGLATDAQKEFEARHDRAAGLRAGFERVFALHRSLQTKECVEEAGRLETLLAGTGYVWLIAQNRIEKSVCLSLRGEMQQAIELAESAASVAQGASLSSTAMRARGMLSSDLAHLGNLRGSMELAAASLEAYWSEGYPFNYAHQFFGDLSEACGQMGLLQSAYVFREASVDALMQTSELLLQAVNLSTLSVAAGRAGRKAEAAMAEGRSRALFERVPESRLKQEYLVDATMIRAAAAAKTGEAARSLRLLNGVTPEKLASDVAQMRYFEARATAYWKLGEVEEARKNALAVVHRNWLRGGTLLSPADRIQAVERQSQAYRLLTEIALRNDGDPYSAFVLWQAYRAREAARRPIDFEPVDGLAARDRVAKWSRALRIETFLSLARLPGGLVAWVLDDERLECRRLEQTPEWVAAQIDSLARKCADSASDSAAVEAQAKALADALFGPLRAYLRQGRILVVDADAALSKAPFAVLFGGAEAPLVRSAGLVEYFTRSATPALQPLHSTLGLAYAPSLTPEWERLYPPLTDAAQEADEVAGGFGRVVRLQGGALTPSAFTHLLASTEAVHFAGHSSGDSRDGALLLSPEPSGAPYSGLLTSSQIARQDAQRCQIAVLSACSTGAGEENGPVNPESLVRVLLNSGVRRVVASQWNVDSASTRRLMAIFYRRMQEGSFPAQALAQAAAEIRSDPRRRHPYYWAAFQMFGYH